MVKMTKDNKEYDIAEHRVKKLLKRGFKLVQGTPDTQVVDNDQEDHKQNGDV